MKMIKRRPSTADDGFSLLEVVVAIMLLTMVMTGLLGFFIRGVASSADAGRRANAVALANQTLEVVRTVAPTGGASSPLLEGRSSAAVSAQWSGAGVPAGLSDLNQAADSAPAGAPTLPLLETKNIDGETYDIRTFIGSCNRKDAVGGPCTKTETGGLMYKVIVQVTWNTGNRGGCAGGSACSYQVATLIDPSVDPQFNSNNP